MSCPLCGNGSFREVLTGSSFRCCRSCRTVYNADHTALEYSDSYFTTDYQAQYGKTYEEDFDNIYKAAVRRIDRINALWKIYSKKQPASILDIGCALGFFLKAASDNGYTRLKGVECSEYAGRRAKDLYNLDVLQKPFETASLHETFDVVTAWYFLEHAFDSMEVLKKISSLISRKGILAFSVPCVFGPSFILHRKEWAKTHPVDHRIDVSPSVVKNILKHYGFKKVKVYPAGIHPNRVLSEKNPLFFIFKPLYRFFSNMFTFSDTIEVYAVKD
jgi:2-polyprenyl-3-methyl-5-hydroxy-6-metoxy-1,4-benzoquinol methylase